MSARTALVALAFTGPATALLAAVPTAGYPPSIVGAWEAPFDGEAPAVNLALLADGRVLYWSGVEANESDADPAHVIFFTAAPLDAQSRILDLAGPSPVVTTPGDPDGAAGDLFCSGQLLLPDGRVLAAGGSDWETLPDPAVPLHGLKDARVFDPATDDWTRVADMNAARWYPSVIETPDGKPLSISGIYNLSQFITHQTSMETYDAAADRWSLVPDGDRLLPLYPRVYVVPGGPLKGQLYYSTVGTLWGTFGEHPLEGLWSLQQAFDGTAWSFLGPSLFGARQHASSVMLPVSSPNDYAPRVLTFGGTLQRSVAATPLAEIADLSFAPPRNSLAAPLHQARWHVNGVVLPDGKVLAVGGGAYDNVVVHGQPNVPVLPAEIYDPATDTWTVAAAMAVPRMYHSTAILLPDARVLVGGHVPLPNPFHPLRVEIVDGVAVNPQIVETRLEIYDPPYLFRGTRPTILHAPATVAFGQTFIVRVRDVGALHSVVLVHPGATTHAFDSSQRSIVLDVRGQYLGNDGSTYVAVRAPPDGVVAPPGPYMLFVNRQHADGAVPSVATFVNVG